MHTAHAISTDGFVEQWNEWINNRWESVEKTKRTTMTKKKKVIQLWNIEMNFNEETNEEGCYWCLSMTGKRPFPFSFFFFSSSFSRSFLLLIRQAMMLTKDNRVFHAWFNWLRYKKSSTSIEITLFSSASQTGKRGWENVQELTQHESCFSSTPSDCH